MPISPIDDPAHSPLAAQSLEASFTVADIRQSLGWYREALGFTVDREFERDGRLLAVSLRAGTVRILLTQDDGAKGLDRVKGDGFSLQFQALSFYERRGYSVYGVLDGFPPGSSRFHLRKALGETPGAAT